MTTNISQITEELDALHERLDKLENAVDSVQCEYNNYLDSEYRDAEICGITIDKPARILKQFDYTAWRTGLLDWIDQQIRESNIKDNIKDLEEILDDSFLEIDFFRVYPISKKEYEDVEITENQVHDYKYKATKIYTIYTGEYVSLYTGNYIYIEIDYYVYVRVYCTSGRLEFCDITEEIVFDLAKKIAEKLD